MRKRSLSIAVFLTTFFSPHLFSANLLVDYDDQKEGSYSTQPNNQVEQPKQVCDYTILNNKNFNHTLEDIEDDLEDNILNVNRKLITIDNQSPPLLLGAVLQHKQTKKHHQYLIAATGLLSKSTQPNAVKRAHKKGFHLIKATRGHIIVQLLEWLQICKHYSVIALHTNRPVCRNCYLIAHCLWEKELKTNEKGCIEAQFSVLDKMPNLAQQYIDSHLNFPLVQSLVVPMMEYVSKEEMQKAIQQKNKQLKEKDTKKQQELKKKDQEIQSQTFILEILNKQINMLSNEVETKDKQIDEKNDHIKMLNKEINKKDNQLDDKNSTISTLNNQVKANEQKIEELQKLLEEQEKNSLLLDNNAKRELFEAIKNNNLKKVKLFLYAYKDIVNVTENRYTEITPFLCAAREGQLAIAKLLRQRGANIHAKDKEGDNALHLASLFSGSVEMVTWLIDECKMDIESKGEKKKTPFLCAVERGKLAIAKLLRQRRARVKATNEDESNALHEACFSGSVEMVTWLLDECHIDIESKDDYQRTPFLLAAIGGNIAIAKLLKERDANIYAKDKFEKNALWWSKRRKHEAMINYLKELRLTYEGGFFSLFGSVSHFLSR